MSEWKDYILALVGSTPIWGLVIWWLKSRRDDRIARELASAQRVKDALREAREAQQEVKAMLQDRIKYELVRGDSSDLTGRLLNEMAGHQREFVAMMPEMAARQRQLLEAVTELLNRGKAPP